MVFLFFLANDIVDLGGLTDGQMSAFLNTRPADHSTPYFDTRVPRKRWRGVEAYRALESRLADLYVVKAFDFLRESVRARWRTPTEASTEDLRSLPPVPGGPGSILAMRFHLHALRKIQNLAHRNRFAFVHVFTYTGHIPDEAAYERILEAFCRIHGIAFLSLRPVFERAVRNGEDVFLRGDGHLSDGGARLAAQTLAQYIDGHPMPASEP